jgi:hypothetical protein
VDTDSGEDQEGEDSARRVAARAAAMQELVYMTADASDLDVESKKTPFGNVMTMREAAANQILMLNLEEGVVEYIASKACRETDPAIAQSVSKRLRNLAKVVSGFVSGCSVH